MPKCVVWQTILSCGISSRSSLFAKTKVFFSLDPRYKQWSIPSLFDQPRRKNPLVHKGLIKISVIISYRHHYQSGTNWISLTNPSWRVQCQGLSTATDILEWFVSSTSFHIKWMFLSNTTILSLYIMDVYLCISCDKEVRRRQHSLQCDGCERWQHRLCKTGTFYIWYLKILSIL